METKARTLLKQLFFSVGMKINVIFGLMIVLFIAFSSYNQVLLSEYTDAYMRQISLHSSILDLKGDFARCSSSIGEYLKTGNRSRLSDFNNTVRTAKHTIAGLYPLMTEDESFYILRSIDDSFESYFGECNNASFLYNTGNNEFYGRMFYAESIQGYLQKYCDEFLGLILADSIAASSRMIDQRRSVQTLYRIVSAFLVLLFFTFLGYVTLNITRPLEKLVAQARAVSVGDFSVRVPVRNPENSVGMLTLNFNRMVSSIDEMMESIRANMHTEKKLLEEQRKNLAYKDMLNQATFLALQTQTNPHFLFNTLSSISRTITLNKKEQALLMIDALATLLRYSLTDAETPVTLGEELAITREYLKIQTLRFQDRIRSSIDVEDGMDSRLMLPRFTLQPLVENAIVHGLEPKEEGGRILIDVRSRGSLGIIRIYDDGPGIPPEKLASMREQDPVHLSRHIGVSNTRKRIQLFTGSDRAFSISSRKGRGTLITIRLPMEGKS